MYFWNVYATSPTQIFKCLSVPQFLSHQVDHKDEAHDKLLAFNRMWITHFARDSLLVFSTGRSPELFYNLAVRTLASRPRIVLFLPRLHTYHIKILQWNKIAAALY